MDDEHLRSSGRDDMIANNYSLLTEFRCHVYLGQWELARACALAVLRASFTTEDDKNFVKGYLKELAVCPEALSTCVSPSVLSPHHLSWQAAKFLEENFPEEDVSSLKNDAEFRILLDRVDGELPKECREELHQLYSGARAGMGSLSAKCRASLHRSLLHFPLETHHLLSHFLQHSPASEDTAFEFEVVYLKAELHLLKQIKLSSRSKDAKPDTKSSALHILSLIPESAPRSADPSSETATLLESIFRDLVDLVDDGALREEEVLGSMACRKSPRLLQLFSDKLNDHHGRKRLDGNDESQLAVSPTTGELNVREAFLKSVVSGEHFVQTLLRTGVEKILECDAGTTRNLFSDPLLNNLFPVALVLAWDRASSDQSALCVIEAVRASKGWNCSDTSLRNLLERLQYNLTVTDWIVAVYRDRKSEMGLAEERSRRRSVFDMLLHRSPLCVIHNLLGLTGLDRNSLLGLLRAAPARSDTVARGSELEPPGTKEESASTFPPDAVLYTGYLVLLYAMESFYVAVVLDRATPAEATAEASSATFLGDESDDGELWDLSWDSGSFGAAVAEHGFREVYRHTVLARLKRFREEVCTVRPLTFRLELLEDAFSLLFVTESDLRQGEDEAAVDTDNGCDSSERRSVVAGRRASVCAVEEKGKKTEERPAVVATTSKEASDSVSAKGSTASSSGGPVGGSAAGFLCPHFLVADVLHCLSGAIVSTQAAAFALGAVRERDAMATEVGDAVSSISWEEFPARLEALNKHVIEAQWRYDLVATSSNLRLRSLPAAEDAKVSAEDMTVTGKESRKPRKKKRHSSARLDLGEPTVIEKMLSPFEALLRHCLWHGNYGKAHQIVELLDLGHTPDAQELFFSERLFDVVQCVTRSSNSRSPPPSGATDALAEVGRAAHAGLRLTSATSLVDRMLCSSDVPRIPEAEHLLRSADQTSAVRSFVSEYGEGGPVAAAVADLAFTTGLACDVSERLLALALGKRHSTTKPVASGIRWRGLVSTVERMRQFLHEASDIESAGGLESILCTPGSSSSLTSLLCGYLYSMDPNTVREQRGALRELGAQLNEVASLLESSKTIADGGGDRKNQLHKAFFRLTEISGSQLRTRLSFLPAFHFDYLRCIYAHVRQVHKAICDVARQGKLRVSRPGSSYFWVLSQSPAALLSTMVLRDEVSPARLEDLSGRMKINLVQVLAQDCCPQIPLWQRGSELPLSTLNILNNDGTPEVEPRHPNYVVKCLLQDLVQLLKAHCDVGDCVVALRDASRLGRSSEFCAWASGCAELGFLDLDQLSSSAGHLAFFLNVVNLLTLHTAIVQSTHIPEWELDATSFVPVTSPYVHQRLIAETQYGYCVGQLGATTLFQLKRQILFRGYPLDGVGREDPLLLLLEELDATSWEKYAPSLHPKVVFSLVQGRISDPKLEVIYPETIESQLQAAVDRCMAQIKAMSADGKRKIIFPWQMAFFIESRIGLDEGSEELRDSLKRLVPEGFLVEFQKEDSKFGIVLDTPVPVSVPEAARSDAATRIPHGVLSYLENRSPLLGQLLKYMQPKASKELHFEESSHCRSPLERLLQHYYGLWAQLATRSGHGPWLSLALQGRASGPLVWEALQEAAAQKDAISALALLDLVDAVEGLGSHPDLAAYKQTLLWLLASCSGDKDDDCSASTEPWQFALRIEDPKSRAECILANYIRWPDEEGVAALETVFADCSSKAESKLCLKLRRELEKVALYKEVEEKLKSAPSSAFSSWRDVARHSLSDPALVLEQLSVGGCYEHAVRWAELHEVPTHCHAVVTELRVLHHLHKDPPESSAAFEIVSECETEEAAFLLCRNALRRLPDGPGKIDALDFVLDNYAQCLVDGEAEEFKKISMGLRMYVCINPRKRDDYAHLVSRPDLLLEQLLMNSEVDCLGECLQAASSRFGQDCTTLTRGTADGLLEKYASKALELLLLPMPSSEPETGPTLSGIPVSPAGADETFVMPTKPPLESEWVPDEKVAFCMVCREERFGVFSRRHHCRRCGRVVCASCSQRTLPVDGYGKKTVRVCEDCFDQTVNPTAVGIEVVPAPLPSSKGLRFNPHELPSPSSLRSRRKSTSLGAVGAHGSGYPKSSALWVLNLDDDENVFTREHFYYERAPSVSLCLSILAKHSSPTRCATFILLLCENLFAVLAPKASSDTLVDYGLIISMMSSLILSAKVKCEETGHGNGVEWCDAYLRRLDIVRLMVTNNCQHLIPDEMLLRSEEEVNGGLDPQRYWQPERKLRDRLIESERMVLALEVSTKCGLEKSGIFAAWGLAMLRAGDWAAAREKFSYCLQRPKDRGKSAVESPLLREVVASLEKSLYPGISKAAAVFCAIASLKAIRDPGSEIKPPATELKNLVFNECRYYLERYGTHSSMLEFLLRHRRIPMALDYFLAESCDPELLGEQLIQPALVRGELEQVLSGIRALDPSLARFWPALLISCRQLQRNSLFHSLYRIQLFMEDFIRAAMTSIQFFERPPARSYSELHGRLRHLADARAHLETYLQKYTTQYTDQQPAKKGRQVFKMAPTEVNRHLSMVNLQIDITRFLNAHETEGKLIVPGDTDGTPDGPRGPPTLFGSIARKRDLACMVLANGATVDEGFGLAFRIVQEHHLSGAHVFERASEVLQRERGGEQVRRLVGCIASCGYPKKYDADAVVLRAVEVMVARDEERKDLDVLVKCLKSDVNKIEAYMLSGRLKSAYLLAVRNDRTEHIRRIMALAEEAGQESIRAICEKRLQTVTQR